MKTSSTKDGQSGGPVEGRWLNIAEIRLVADLRVMHAKVDELYQIVTNLKRRHSHASIHKYADKVVLAEDITRVDEIYMWFVDLKDQLQKEIRARGNRSE